MSTLTIDNVTKVYRSGRKEVLAVDRLSMEVADGEIIGLLGSSGCGKTSTLRMIAGFETVTRGEIRINQRVLNDLAPARRNIAMAFEGYALYPPLRVRDNIGFALLRNRRPQSEIERRVREVAELLEIGGILDRYPPTISAGQQQRTSLARALVREADLHLLDEPMSQLEPQLRAVLRARIKDWLTRRNMTTIFVTHDQTEAVALADRIAVMEKGVLQQFASPSELRDRPANLFVAGFIGEPPMNLFPARIERDASGRLRLAALDDRGAVAYRIDLPSTVEVPALHRRLTDGRIVEAGIRPHKVRLGRGLTGRVLTNRWLGDQTHLGIDVSGRILTVLSAHPVNAAVGSTIELELPVAAMSLFDRDSGLALFHGCDEVPS